MKPTEWVTVLSREGCHLCEEVIEELEPMCHAAGVRMQVVDVDSTPDLQQRFGERIPVVCGGSLEISSGAFDRMSVVRWLGLD